MGTQNGICRKGGANPAGNALSVFPFISLTDPTLSNSFARVQRTTMDHFTTRLLRNMWAGISLEATHLCFWFYLHIYLHEQVQGKEYHRQFKFNWKWIIWKTPWSAPGTCNVPGRRRGRMYSADTWLWSCALMDQPGQIRLEDTKRLLFKNADLLREVSGVIYFFTLVLTSLYLIQKLCKLDPTPKLWHLFTLWKKI